MKKFLFTMVTLLSMAVSSQAMSYEQARQQALFLADKMAYELNLTEDQYEACYEVNLDYLMGVTGEADLYGDYWTRRNLDLSYILLDWQYRAYLAASYFYRPLYWSNGYWHFGIYAHYPHRHYYYFGRPAFWNVYRGGHAWHNNGGHSWYHGRSYGHVNGQRRPQADHRGMRDGFNKGDYGRGHDFGNDNGRPGRNRIGQSSTRSTVGNHGANEGRRGAGVRRDGGSRSHAEGSHSTPSTRLERRAGSDRSSGVTRSVTPKSSGTQMRSRQSTSRPQSSASFSGSRSSSSAGSSHSSGATRSVGGSSHGGGSHAGGGSHGGRR